MEAEIKKLEAALSLIKEVADSTHLNINEDEITYNLSLLKLCNKYNLKLNDVKNYNEYDFCLGSNDVNFVIVKNPIWNEFKNELLSYNCIDYDQMNFNFVYNMEDGIRLSQDFDSIYKKYAEKFNALYKIVKINKMKEELKKLEEAD